MPVHWIGLGGLFSELLDVTRPLLDRGDQARKHHDRAVKEAESQVATTPKKAVPLEVALALPVAQIVELRAEPPLHWSGAGWRCAAATRVVIRSTDQREHVAELAAGTDLPVRAGMLLVPPTPES